MRPINVNKLTQEERIEAVGSLMFLKQKRDPSIKARTCADGRPQQEGTAKQESPSPTASLESIMLTSAIDAMEG